MVHDPSEATLPVSEIDAKAVLAHLEAWLAHKTFNPPEQGLRMSWGYYEDILEELRDAQRRLRREVVQP